MRLTFYFILILLVFCKCAMEPAPPGYCPKTMPQIFDCSDEPLPELPDKELEEISIWGIYWYGDSGMEKERKLANMEAIEKACPPGEPDNFYNGERESWLGLRCSSLREYNKIKYPSFSYDIWEHCYQKKTNPEPVFDKSLLFRLYDKEGNKLAEDYFKIDGPLYKETAQNVIGYLPYVKGAYETRVIKLIEGKEVLIGKKRFEDKASLGADSLYIAEDGRQCHRGGYIPAR